MARLRFGLVVVLLWGIVLGAPAWAQSEIEVPTLTGRVVDQAELLSPATEQLLTQQLAAHADSTSNQVVVLTVESLQGWPIERYALEVARTWQLGQASLNNGVLLLIAEQDRAMRIEVGYGLEGALPDVIASRIIRYELRPAFRRGDFDEGVQAGVQAILDAIAGTYEPPPASSNNLPWVGALLMTLFGLVVAGGSAYVSLRLAARGGIIMWLITLFFAGPFILGGSFAFLAGLVMLLPGSFGWSAALMFLGLPAVGGAYFISAIRVLRDPKLKAFRKKAADDETITETVHVWPFTFGPAFWTSGVAGAGTGSFGSGFGHGGSSFGSSGGFGGGGGFSGGGGSFGGGGASGGW